MPYNPSRQAPLPPRLPVPPRPTTAASTPVPRPIVRGVAPEEPPPPPRRPEPLSIPSPETLGVSGTPSPSAPELCDWEATRRRLRDLGATSFQVLEQRRGWSFRMNLPTRQPGQSHRIEAEGRTEAEAVRLALAEAERWVAQQR